MASVAILSNLDASASKELGTLMEQQVSIDQQFSFLGKEQVELSS